MIPFMNVTTYRLTRSQLRIQLGFFTVFAGLTVVAAWYVLQHLNHGHFTRVSGGAAFWGALAAFLALAVGATMIGSTTVDDHGLRALRAWGRRSIAWSDISRIDVVREDGRDIASTRVRVTPVHGRPFKVLAPIHSDPYAGDPEFEAKVAEIKNRWLATTAR